MNNSFISQEDEAPKTEQREAFLVNVIEALEIISHTKEWETLKTELFENLAHNLEVQLTLEAKKEDPDPCKLNRLSGQLIWANRYADLDKYARTLKLELQGIRKRNYGNE